MQLYVKAMFYLYPECGAMQWVRLWKFHAMSTEAWALGFTSKATFFCKLFFQDCRDQQNAKQRIGSLEEGLTGGCELPVMVTEIQILQYRLLTNEPAISIVPL